MVATPARVAVTHDAPIDGTGTWLIPGLADAHVHVALSGGESLLGRRLPWGVTTVRDLGGDPDTVPALRERERRGLTADPLADIGNTRAIEAVFKDGIVCRRDDLWVR